MQFDIFSLIFEVCKQLILQLPQMLTAFWPLLILCVIIIFYKIIHYIHLSKSGIFDIDKMDGSDFERRLDILFTNLGYKVQRIGKTGDFGVDLIIEKNGRKTAVQAKCYKKEHVGEKSVQEVNSGKQYYQCDDAIVVTNNKFTKMAYQLANAVGVKLWNRNYLIKVLLTEKQKNIG